MWCQGDEDATLLVHSDQFRGVKTSYNMAGEDPGDTIYAEPNPDYFQLLDLGGEGQVPVGYGHRSVEYIIRCCRKASEMTDLEQRQKFIQQLDDEGIMATLIPSHHASLQDRHTSLPLMHGCSMTGPSTGCLRSHGTVGSGAGVRAQ